jgi:hypothetical protein
MIGTARTIRAWLIETTTDTSGIQSLTKTMAGLGRELGIDTSNSTPSVRSVREMEV